MTSRPVSAWCPHAMWAAARPPGGNPQGCQGRPVIDARWRRRGFQRLQVRPSQIRGSGVVRPIRLRGQADRGEVARFKLSYHCGGHYV
jgi:hypothetical protein